MTRTCVVEMVSLVVFFFFWWKHYLVYHALVKQCYDIKSQPVTARIDKNGVHALAVSQVTMLSF